MTRLHRAAVAAFLLLVAPLAALAQVTLDGAATRIDPWSQVRVLLDPEGRMSLEDAVARRDAFAAPKGAYATLGMDKGVLWVRLPVRVAAGGEGLWILDVDYPLLRRVDVDVVAGGRSTKHVTVGDAEPFASRPLQSRSLAVPLDLPRDAAVELFLRVDTAGAKILPLALHRLPSFHAHSMTEQMLQGAFGCLAVFLLVYSLSQWTALREALYLKYALLVACSALFSIHFFGIGEMYLWRDAAWPEFHLAGVTSLLAAAATALFVEDALRGDLHPWLRRGLAIVAAVQIAATLVYAVNLIDIQTVAVFMSTTGLAPALMGLQGAVRKARRGDSVGTWFIVAWLGYFISSAVLVGVVRGRIGVNFWTMHSFQIGATLDMLIFIRIAVLRSAARHVEAKRAARERDTLHSLAHTDPLTGLLNRRGLDDAVPAALARLAPGKQLAAYVIDLDGFKPVNDQYGHDVGDALLRVVAQRLRWCTRTGDVVARLGGDEFVVLAEALASQKQAEELGRKLLDAFASRFALDGRDCEVSATIGYALAPDDASDAHSLLKAADVALYAGKQAGKNRLARTPQSTLPA
jgi:diguanylate cyclase (GGDEF)-like protein